MKTARGILLVVFATLVFAVISRAQTRLVTCTTERNQDNSLSIYADCNISGEYTLKLDLSGVRGYKITGGNMFNNIDLVPVLRGKREVVRFTPEKSGSVFSFSYRYYYYPGTALRKTPADSNFLYMLPGTTGNELRVSAVNSIDERLGHKNEYGYTGIGFTYNKGDTICAARAGIAYYCNDDVTEGEKKIEVYRSERNMIGIQHRDGTMGSYVFRSPIKLLISEGDDVMPGQPIAVFSKESESYMVLFSVSYLDEKKLLLPDDKPIPRTTYLTPVFCNTEDGTPGQKILLNTRQTVTHPKQLMAVELTKKEKKRLGL